MNDTAKKCYDTAIRYEGGEPHGILVRAGDVISELTQKTDELQRQNAMLIDALREHIEYVDHSTGSGGGRELRNKAAIAYFATKDQSAEWLEASRIEWMKNLKPVLWISPEELPFERDAQNIYSTIENFDGCTLPLYSIPTKEVAK